MACPWPQPPRLCPRTPTTIPTACLLSVPQQSFDRSSQARARETFSPSRVPLSSQKGRAEASVDPLPLACDVPIRTTASGGFSVVFFPMAVSWEPHNWPGSLLDRPFPDPARHGCLSVSSTGKASGRDWVEVGWGKGVSAPPKPPPHKHTRVGTNYASHRGGAKPSGKHTTICLSAPDLLTGSRPRGPTRQRTQNLGGQRFRSHFPTHTGTCTACPRTQGAAETAALKQPGLASAPPSRSVGFRGNRA